MVRPKLLLAEDHALVRTLLRVVLGSDFEIVATVQRGDEICSAAEHHMPDVVLLDVSLPGMSGLQALPHLRAILPSTVIVILSTHNDGVYREEAFRRGADAYVSKASLGEELIPAITKSLLTRQARPLEALSS